MDNERWAMVERMTRAEHEAAELRAENARLREAYDRLARYAGDKLGIAGVAVAARAELAALEASDD